MMVRWLPFFLFLGLVTPLAAQDSPLVAHIRLSGDLDETPTAHDPLFDIQPENLRIKLERIHKARKDKNVQALYLHLDHLQIGLGKVNELRQAIEEVRKSGKKVICLVEDAQLSQYLVAASADSIVMPESGTLFLVGMRMEISFYKDLIEMLGAKADVLQMGDFKGAAEPFTRSTISPQLRQQLESMLDDKFTLVCQTIAEGRKNKGLTAEKVQTLIDEGPFTAREAHKRGLIDHLAYEKDLNELIRKELNVATIKVERNYGKRKPKDLDFGNPFAILKLLAPPKEGSTTASKIALIYAVGPITHGKGGQSMFGGNVVGSDAIVEAIRKADRDLTVKAIVLRVDSPGGSALASDLMWDELMRCKKPVVASMGDVAASGGYYISMAAKKIYAEPGTLTGSIGVVGGKLVTSGAFKKVGIHTDVISRGANSGVLSDHAAFSETERKAMTTLMRDVYDQFLDKAIQGRKKAGRAMTREELEKLAGGRVWSGRQAKENGLVDELGTLHDAIGAAKQLAGFKADDELELLILPKPKSFLEALLEKETEVSVVSPVQRELFSSVFSLAPELREPARKAEALFHLRRERVWAIQPIHLDIK
jgi:protease-4